MSDERNYYPELDGLRFFAFLLVFIHHAPRIDPNPFWVKLNLYGWMGVDLFLCLSAYLLTQLLFMEYQRTGMINIRFFYIRRALRIWPLYYLFVIAAVLYTYYYDGTTGLLLRTSGMFALVDNLMTASLLAYNPFYFAAHLWTIAYEEQIYAVIPWVLRFLFSINYRAKTIILISVLILGNIVRSIFIWKQIPHPAIWVMPITHFDSIFIGLIIGLGMLDFIFDKIPWAVTALIGVFSLYLVCKLPNVQEIGWHLMFTYPLVALGMGLILASVLRGGNSPLMRWLFNPPISFLGKISYGLYVYHLVGLHYIGGLLKVDTTFYWPWLFSIFIIPLIFTILISTLSYLFIEKPFLRLKDRFSIVRSRPA